MSKQVGYQNFGSFHTENVEELIRQSDDVYAPPARPFPVADLFSEKHLASFGLSARQHFLLDLEAFVFVNHGAFGAVVTPAHEEALRWRLHCEKQPLRFLDRELFPHIVRVLRELAAFVHCRPQDLVVLPNATTGLNTVIQSIPLTVADAVFSLNIGYGSVKKMVQSVCSATGATAVTGQVTFPIRGPEDVLAAVDRAMPPNTKLAIFDAVTSNTAVLLPLPDLIALCKARGVLVLIDGAHALGMLDVDLNLLGADFFVANCHKWLCAPKGSAMLWVREQHHDLIKPLIISHGAGCGFTSDFIWDGCRDYSPLLAVSAAVRFWQGIGPTQARTYMRDVLTQAVQNMTQRWQTDTLVPLSMCGTMALVRLPMAPQLPGNGPTATSADAKAVQDCLYFQCHVEAPIKCIQAALYVRLSAHIYNVLDDYDRVAMAIEQALQATFNSQ
ncbi:hypothetical protein WJX72_003762 [[Myrmecia] bisecta]|uniref:Aminotransferase class V domain-containing protein n=1 Tax=[Myrmecia] bisecta TaxID=41462 RepID=A0AAW1R653_9CHLO